jgi:hypothetical protein
VQSVAEDMFQKPAKIEKKVLAWVYRA